jgi:predicted ATP-dependent serine protease
MVFNFKKGECMNESHDESIKGKGKRRMLRSMPAIQWLEEGIKLPPIKQLFGQFWIEGEMTVLFSDTGIGKSILAVQIADAITKGKEILGFKPEVSPQKVVYFDCELSGKQFEHRYSNEYKDHYSFSPLFRRARPNLEKLQDSGLDYETIAIEDIETIAKNWGIKIFIIDSLSYLIYGSDKTLRTVPILMALRKLSKKYGLSILIVDHTKKVRWLKPIDINHLYRPKTIFKYVDAVFALGESTKDSKSRYIKQIKCRDGEFLYNARNVINCVLEKPFNFLGFTFTGYGRESEHLKKPF